MPRPIVVLVALTVFALAILALWPGLDLFVAHRFYDGGGFVGHDAVERFARNFFRQTPFFVLAAFLIPYLQRRYSPRLEAWLARASTSRGPIAARAGAMTADLLRRFRLAVDWAPDGRSVLFLIATIAIGSGLIVNLGMKDHLHRPRPAQTQDFGGPDEFRPWYRFDGACSRNCGFASGEAASGFWMVAPALLTPPPCRALMVAVALAFGAGASVLRMAFGGHYLSDVLMGGLISVIVIYALRYLFWSRGGP